MPEIAAAPVAPAAAPTTPANGATPPAAAAAEEFLDIGLVDGKPERIAKAKALERLRKESFADKRTQQAAEALKAIKAEREQLAKEISERF